MKNQQKINQLNYLKKYNKSFIVCTCHRVSLGEIEFAIKNKGAKTIEQIAKYCDAGSGCGSCKSAKNDIKVKKHTLYLKDILNIYKLKN